MKRLVALAYVVFSLLVGAADVVYILRHHMRYPFGDQWVWIGRIYRRGVLGAFAQQINEHRMPVPGIFYFIDHRYLGSGNRLLAALSILVQFGCIALLALPLWRSREIPQTARLVFTGFLLIVAFWFIQGEDFFYPFQMCISFATLGILAGLQLFAGMANSATRGSYLAAIFVCGLWASFSFGHGILIWPVMLGFGLLVHIPRRTWLALLGMSVFAIALYFTGYARPPGSANPIESLRHPLHLIQYAILFLGLPFIGPGQPDAQLSNHPLGYAASVLGIATALIFVLRRPSRENPASLFYSSLTLTALASTLLTALGRANFPLEQALSGRYAPVPLLFWFSLLGLSTIYIARSKATLAAPAWWAILIVASIATLPSQKKFGRYFADRERSQAAAAASIQVGVPDAPQIDAEIANPGLVDYVDRESTAALGHSLFSRSGSELLGHALRDYFQIASPGACQGYLDLITPVASSKTPGARLIGWAWDTSAARDVARILVTDEQGFVRGLGVTHVRRSDVASALHNDAMAFAGWIAYARLPSPAERMNAYGEIGDRLVCHIGTPKKPI